MAEIDMLLDYAYDSAEALEEVAPGVRQASVEQADELYSLVSEAVTLSERAIELARVIYPA